jgi:hypothetical protein
MNKPEWKYNTKLYGDEAARRAKEDPLFAEMIDEARSIEILNAIMPSFRKRIGDE